MFEELVIQSHKGSYAVHFDDSILKDTARLLDGDAHFIIDANVAKLYASNFREILGQPSTILIAATEENKSIENTIPLFERLIQSKVRRGHSLVAIGGGIIQDLTCFVASTLLRGLPWRFVPTTLLAQADSCIGSKSSINLGVTKNILGTYNPPQDIFVSMGFLETLDRKDLQSGIGEILKVHAIEGREAFDQLADDFDLLLNDRAVLRKYIYAALRIKQRFIEKDEFDQGIRNVFNYGHSFGHAIESATHYMIPHGIAVTMGMDMANFIAARRNLLPDADYVRMHSVLHKNYKDFAGTYIPFDELLSALMKDKKNTSTMLGLIFPIGGQAEIQRMQIAPDQVFRSQCAQFLKELNG